MLIDPVFYAAALPAVALYGLSKGGLSGVSLMAVPLMSLVMSPVAAAAVLLPVLIAQDAMTLYAYRAVWDRDLLVRMLPGAVIGIGLGSATAALVTAGQIRLAVGLLAVAFCLNAWFGRGAGNIAPEPHDWRTGSLLGALSGYSSFIIHAGGPPFNVYALKRGYQPDMLAGTSAVFFAVVNLIKVPPYLALGQLTRESLLVSATLIPVALAANLLGIWLVRRIPRATFYRIIYALTFVVGLKLVWDGGMAVAAG